ncbi:MAG: hypothetical protein AAGE05_10115, partial [Pseudomonadota bacterium]
ATFGKRPVYGKRRSVSGVTFFRINLVVERGRFLSVRIFFAENRGTTLRWHPTRVPEMGGREGERAEMAQAPAARSVVGCHRRAVPRFSAKKILTDKNLPRSTTRLILKNVTPLTERRFP